MKYVLCLCALLLSQIPTPGQARLAPSEIVVLTLGQPDFRRLTSNDNSDEEPEWAPDGTVILFDSDRAGSNDLYVMSADGSGRRRLTDHRARDGWPDWSPDGTRIVSQYLPRRE